MASRGVIHTLSSGATVVITTIVALSQVLLEACDDVLHFLVPGEEVFLLFEHRTTFRLVNLCHFSNLSSEIALLVVEGFNLLLVFVGLLF